MKLKVRNTEAVRLNDESFERVLNMYPEEAIAQRAVFAEALRTGAIEFEALRNEAAKTLIDWQLFLLEPPQLIKEMQRIEARRHQAAPVLAAKRSGAGRITSRRILDRLIRCQTYVAQRTTLSKNTLCGALDGLEVVEAAARLREKLGFVPRVFRAASKGDALQHLIGIAEGRQINVCQGVLTNKMLPQLTDSRSVFRNTSGFVLANDKVPFLFLPSEVNPNESDGRQIFTIVYLLVVIGLGAYEYLIALDLAMAMLKSRGKQALVYAITAEFLLPATDTENIVGAAVTGNLRDELARKYKLTPTAVLVILRKRGILSAKQYEALLQPTPMLPKRPGGRAVSIERSVRKFNGKYAFEQINRDFAARRITGVQLQRLLFGSISKRVFREYRRALEL